MSAKINKLTAMQGWLSLSACAVLVFGITLGLTFPELATLSIIGFDLISSGLFIIIGLSHLLADNKGKTYKKTENIRAILVSIPFSSLLIGSHMQLLGFALAALKLIAFKDVIEFLRFKKQNLELKRYHTLAIGGLGFVLCIHSIACLWIIINPSSDTDITTIYIKGIYFIITTMATVGYGDITPSTNLGRLFALSIMIIGVASYSLLVAQISRILLEHDKRKASTQSRLDVLEGFLKHYEIPVELQKSVYGFYNHLLSHQVSGIEEEILSSLPTALQNELKVYMNVKPLAHVSLFKNCAESCIVEASGFLEHVYFSPGDTIVAEGSTGTEMYVVGHGSVKVIKNQAVVAILHSGDCFGEHALIFDDVRHATVMALSYCDLFMLSRENFSKLVVANPELKANIDALEENRKN